LRHPLVNEALRQAGWYPERAHPIEPWVDMLAAEGWALLPDGLAIWRSYGRLYVALPPSPEARFGLRWLRFDPTWAAGDYDKFVDAEAFLGQRLCPLAAEDDAAILMVAEDRRVFTIWEDFILEDGRDFEEALELLVRRHRFPKVHRGRPWWLRAEPLEPGTPGQG
jgi:hypothetical protein